MIIETLDRCSVWASLWLYRLGVYGTLPALLVLVTLEVVLRYVFNAPLEWGRDVNGLLLLVTLFSALPHAWDQGYYVRVQVIQERMSPRWRSFADVLSALAGFVFFSLLTAQAFLFSRYMFVTQETGEDLDILLWPFMVFLAICGLVLSVRLLANPLMLTASEEDVSGRWI